MKVLFRSIIIIGVTLFVAWLTYMIATSDFSSDRETGIWMKEGAVVKIEYDVPFGGTFSDWRDDIYFADGTMISSQERALSSIELNRNGTFYFDKNYFEYDGREYKFDNFKYVIYDDV